jgi:hypothetical protein
MTEQHPLLRKSSVDTLFVWKQKNTLKEETISLLSLLYDKDQLALRDKPETAVTRVEGWCEMATSL